MLAPKPKDSSPAEEGWVAVFRHDEGVYKRYVRDELESGKFEIGILDIATVDVPGMCLYASPYPHRVGRTYIHIGVGSDVVCSIPMGNTRASVRGTDDSDDSTLFLCLDASLLVT